jgi:hypothetical protein
VTAADLVQTLTSRDALCSAVDPDVTWYSADVDSNLTCNDRDEAVACVERNAEAGLTGRFDLVAATDDLAVVRPVVEPPGRGHSCLLLRVRGDLIVEMRTFRSTGDALRYAGLAATAAGGA